jgi:hypothetical protein
MYNKGGSSCSRHLLTRPQKPPVFILKWPGKTIRVRVTKTPQKYEKYEASSC